MVSKNKIDSMRLLGMDIEADRVERGECPFCGRKVDKRTFRDDLSLREFEISGLCQKCQDEVFGK